MTPKPIYEVNHQGLFYPWGFHFQVHFIKEGPGQTIVACGSDDSHCVKNVVGIFDVDSTGRLNFRGRHTSFRDALDGLIFHALSGLVCGLYDPYINGIPLAAVNVMLIRLSDNEIRTLLECPDLLEETMRRLAEAVDRAVTGAIQDAAEEVFSTGIKPDDPAALDLLQKAEADLGVIAMARKRAAFGGWPEPKTSSEFLMWIEDEARAMDAVRQSEEDCEYINQLNILSLRLHSLGIQPALAPWLPIPVAELQLTSVAA